MDTNRVYYVWDENLIKECNRLPAVPGRATLVHELIVAYNLHKHMKIVRSRPATYEELREFHSELYLQHLKTLRDVDENYAIEKQDEECGLGYDCPPVSDMYKLVSTVAGGSITAVQTLILGLADVAINWCGGWHHARRFNAEGFCYVNDIVIAIEKLRRKYPKVLYIDLDVHHGNGVQDAYDISKTVLTLSIHKFEAGFYPGSGGIDDIGALGGKGYAINFPLHGAYSDETLCYAFKETFESVYSSFEPDAVVVQCGADALAHDPHGGACVSMRGYCACVRLVLDKRKPCLLLGGGGYKFANAARLWTSITALVLNLNLDVDIPEHDFLIEYSPGYVLQLDAALAKDQNSKAYLDSCINRIRGNLKKYLKEKNRSEDVVQ